MSSNNKLIGVDIKIHTYYSFDDITNMDMKHRVI